jgi:competence protein ComEC
MLSGMISAAAGIALSTRFSDLPASLGLLPALPLALALLYVGRTVWRCAGCALLGVLWGCWRGEAMLARSLPAALEGEDVAAEVCIDGLPNERREAWGRSWQFQARLMQPVRLARAESAPWRGQQLQLSSYAAQAFKPGERWTMTLRLRAPRGFVNPGGRDHQAWLHANGIDATGYVVWKGAPRPQRAGSCGAPVSRLRYALRDAMHTAFADEPRLGSLIALSIGDGSHLQSKDWDALARTGTTHLLVVSGMHISLVALLIWRMASVCARFSPAALRLLPASAWGAIAALPAAFAYTALAGFALPAERALMMIAVAIGFVLLQRQSQPWLVFFAALLAIVAEQPLAVLQIGFWLSFLAVAALMLVYMGRLREPGYIEMLWKPQFVVMIALAGPLLIAGLPSAPLGPLVNVFAIPLVNVISVPFALIGCLLLTVSEDLAWPFLKLALYSLDVLWFGLERAAGWGANRPLIGAAGGAWSSVAAIAGVLWLLAPRGFPARMIGVLLLLPLMMPATRAPEDLLDVLMLDVGQGTAVILRTRFHTLVYDTGPRFSDRFDAGADIVVPALRELGISRVDTVVVSHADGDHAGGVSGILDNMTVKDTLAGEDIAAVAARPCRRGMHWVWDDVRFEVLHPTDQRAQTANDNSCVLRVDAAGQVILLAGDIEAQSEYALIMRDEAALRADILLVPHHGSRSSSTPAFVAAVRPRFALVSAGYRSRYGHPHPQVVERYRLNGAVILDTAQAGAIGMRVNAAGRIEKPRRWRDEERRYWFTKADSPVVPAR